MWVFNKEMSGVIGFGEVYLTLEKGVLMNNDLSDATLARLEKSSLWTYIEEKSTKEDLTEAPAPVPVEKTEEEKPKSKKRGRPKKGVK